MKRIYHKYELWEDFKNGFYDNCTNNNQRLTFKEDVHKLFKSEKLTHKYMNKVLDEWVYSCEHNLTNTSMNRIAYLGQAACNIYAKVPNLITMEAWKELEITVRDRSDNIAELLIKKWEQEIRFKNTFKIGKREGTATEYQTKLLLNSKEEI